MTKQNIGNSGEYFIAYKLSTFDFTVTITLGRAERFDILALSNDNKPIKFSVKSRLGKNAKSFPLSKKDESGSSDDFYYAFVRFNEDNSEPDFWIIPSKRVCEVIKKSSTIYFQQKKRKDGKSYVDKGLRGFDLILRNSIRDLYDEGWEDELKIYYKNINQLIS